MYAHDLDAAVPETAHASSTPKSQSFDEVSRQAAAALAAGNTDQAIHIYQGALQLHPEWDEGRWNLAMLSYSAGRYPEAIVALKACVARRPDYGTAWAVLGLAEFEIKDYGNALIHLQRGQDLGMGGSKESVQLARYRLGVLLNRDTKFDLAAELLAPEVGPGPLAEKIQFALGMALLHMSLLPDEVEASKNSLVLAAGEIAALAAGQQVRRSVSQVPDSVKQTIRAAPFLHYAYGTALEALSQYDDAESQLRQEIVDFPEE